MTLANFLTFAKDKPIAGILINIENAAYLEGKLSLNVTDSVLNALSKAGYDNQTHLEVIIQSANISVLNKFKQLSKYKRMYLVDESVGDALNSSIEDIKQSADFVAISKDSIYPENRAFLTGSTGLVAKLQSFGLSVYVYLLRNEFISQAWDFFSDATVEINSYVSGAHVDGIISDYPGTARRYKRNACLRMGEQMPAFMKLVEPGALLDIMAPEALPPAQAPLAVLNDSDVEEPPLPAVSEGHPSVGDGGNASEPTGSGQPCNAVPSIITYLTMLLFLGSLLI